MQRDADLIAGSATGSIYDLGYRRYTGPRLGRAHAFRVLFGHSLRWTFGIGRGGRAKLAPFALAAIMLLPALMFVGVRALIGDNANRFTAELPQPATFVRDIQTILAFFVIAQAPELLGRDQRHRTLTLYFCRSMGRVDYALAKYLALTIALVLVILVPQAVMLLGILFTSTDLAVGLGSAAPLIPPVLISAFGVGGLLAGISLAIAAFAPRRAYAAGAIAGLLLVFSSAVSLIVARAADRSALGWVALLDPGSVMNGLCSFLFGSKPDVIVLRSGVPLPVFAAATVVISLACLGLLIARYRRIPA